MDHKVEGLPRVASTLSAISREKDNESSYLQMIERMNEMMQLANAQKAVMNQDPDQEEKLNQFIQKFGECFENY